MEVEQLKIEVELEKKVKHFVSKFNDEVEPEHEEEEFEDAMETEQELESKSELEMKPDNAPTIKEQVDQDLQVLSSYIAAAQIQRDLEYLRDKKGIVSHAYIQKGNKHESCMPIVIDTGCSLSLTPIKSDFVTKLSKTEVTDMQGIGNSIPVKGVGEVEWPVRDAFNNVALIRTKAYFVPDADIRLFSPQTYVNKQKNDEPARMTLTKGKLEFCTTDGINLEFPYNPGNNLPLMYVDNNIHFAGLTSTMILNLRANEHELTNLKTLLDTNNHNLSEPRKEVLLWHYRLCHAGVGWIKNLMGKKKNDVGTPFDSAPIQTKHKGTSTCNTTHLKCPACQLGKQHRCTPDTSTTRLNPGQEMKIRAGDLKPGDRVSLDQYVCKTPGRLPHTFGKEHVKDWYNGGTLAYDHASQLIFLTNQISLAIGETLTGKHSFERFAALNGVKIKSYRCDNQPFTAAKFLDDLEEQNQTISLSGVGAHHQNGVAERAIQTVFSWTRTMLLHQLIHWPDQFDKANWPFALEHAIAIWNHLPRTAHGQTPIEIFTGLKTQDPQFLLRCRVWGSPCYVLDPRLQDGKRIPKFTKRSRLGMYMGLSNQHSSSVGRILNLQTGNVSPQYHVIHDEQFTSVHGTLSDELFDAGEWNSLIKLDPPVNYVDPNDVVDGHPPFERMYEDFLHDNNPNHPVIDQSAGSGGEEDSSDNDDDFDPFDFSNDQQIEEATTPSRTTRSGKSYMSTAYSLSNTPTPQPMTSNSYTASQRDRFMAGGAPNSKIRAHELESEFTQGLDWSKDCEHKSYFAKRTFAEIMKSYDPIEGTVESWNPLAFAAKTHDADLPSFQQALNGPRRKGFIEAMKKEITTLINMDTWTVVKKQPWMKVTPLTWVLRIKRTAGGLISKLKARICVRGDLEVEGVDYFETYAPTAKWTTIRFMLVMAAAYDLCTCQIDYTSPFVQAEIEKPPNWNKMTKQEQDNWGIYVDMPRGFAKHGHVLKLKRNLYGRSSAPRQWFALLKKRLGEAGFIQQLDVDPCLFISDKVIMILFVDDSLLFAKDKKDLDAALVKLRSMGLALEIEDDVGGFLGVKIDHSVPGQVTMTQTGLIEKIIADLHIEDLPTVDTPATGVLGTDADGDPPSATFNYASIVGALWYLSCHSRPDIQFALSQCSRFSFNTRRSHELALIRIGQYLKGTPTKGMTFKPGNITELSLDVYVDSDFLGLHGHEDRNDPTNVKSRAGFTMLLNNCPLIWSSSLMTDVCLSTMMAEYYALSHCMREVLPLRELIKTVAPHCGFDKHLSTTFKTTLHEDSTGCITLANLEPGQHTPRSKFYDSKVHWFRSFLHADDNGTDGPIVIQKIDTKIQLADIFTKALPKKDFERLRMLLQGW